MIDRVRKRQIPEGRGRFGITIVSDKQKDNVEKKYNMNIFDLEYSKLEKAEMITYLNKLLTSYQIYVHKTRTFYWNVIGQDHFDLRQGFKIIFRRALVHMDEIAERIRLFNQKTIVGWKDIKENSEIKEASAELTGFEMVKATVSDIRTLLKIQTESIEKATELGDFGTESLLKDHMKELEQDYLLLASWLK
jgi:starvation-inducible DNA-binding protein